MLVRLAGAVLATVADAADGEHDHAGEDADDHDDDEELDEREALVLLAALVEPLKHLLHWVDPFVGVPSGTEPGPLGHRVLRMLRRQPHTPANRCPTSTQRSPGDPLGGCWECVAPTVGGPHEDAEVRTPTRRKLRATEPEAEADAAQAAPVTEKVRGAAKRAANGNGTKAATNGHAVSQDPAHGHARLGELLLARELISPDALREALLAQSESSDDHRRLGDVLVAGGALDEAALALALAEQFSLPIADLRATTPTDEALELLPETVARSCNAVPVRVLDGGALEVVVGDPTPEVRAALAEAVRGPIELLVASPTDVRRLLDSSYRVLGDVNRFVNAFELTEAKRGGVRRRRRAGGRRRAHRAGGQPASSPRRCATGPATCTSSRRTSVLRIRFRIDGALHDALELPDADGARPRRAGSRSWPS